jgi:hypothetical protein
MPNARQKGWRLSVHSGQIGPATCWNLSRKGAFLEFAYLMRFPTSQDHDSRHLQTELIMLGYGMAGLAPLPNMLGGDPAQQDAATRAGTRLGFLKIHRPKRIIVPAELLLILPLLLMLTADLDLQAGRIRDAAAHLREGLQATIRAGDWSNVAVNGLWYCAMLCAATGRPADAGTTGRSRSATGVPECERPDRRIYAAAGWADFPDR